VPEGSATRAVMMSTSTQLVARAFDLAVNVVVSLAIVRALGPSQYGDFVLVISVVGLAGLLSEFGLPKLAVREISRDTGARDDIVGTVTVTRLALSVLSIVVVQVVLFAFQASAAVRIAALVAGAQFVGEALLSVVVVFHVALRQQHEAFVRLAANVVKLTVVLVLVAHGAGLVPLVGATTAQVLIAAALAWVIARRRYAVRLRWDRSRVTSMLKASLPVGPAMLIGVLYLKLDALMVWWFGSRGDVGVYGAAYQPVEYLFLASAVVVQVLFPLLARAHGDPATFTRVYRRGTDLLLVVVLPVSIVLAFCAQPLVDAAFRSEYHDAAAPLAILAIALVFMTINVWQGLVLLAAGRQRANLAYLSLAVAVNVVLDVVLVQRFGPAGAALGTLGSAAFLVACSTFAVARLAGATPAPDAILRVLAAGAALALTLGLLRGVGVNWLLAALVGGLAYLPVLAVLGVFGRDELAALRRNPSRPVVADVLS
jgi:O-antigen/teichoic acid export membrane protein